MASEGCGEHESYDDYMNYHSEHGSFHDPANAEGVHATISHKVGSVGVAILMGEADFSLHHSFSCDFCTAVHCGGACGGVCARSALSFSWRVSQWRVCPSLSVALL